MAASERHNDQGDLRYFKEIGTTTVNTTTALTFSQTAVDGAIYHAMQVEALNFGTSSATFVAKLEGTMEDTPANWFTIQIATITAAGTTLVKPTISTWIPMAWVRAGVLSIGGITNTSFDVNIIMRGQGVI